MEEESSDVVEDGILNFENDIYRMVGGVNISSSSNTRSSGKRKERDPSESRAKKKKTYEIGVQMLPKWDELLESMSTKE